MHQLRREDRDLPGLTVLALLMTGPRHTYEMHRMMIDYHKDFVTGLPRSMYHAADRLRRDGHVEVVGSTSEGGRPERTVYAITGSGRAELAERLARLLAVPDPDADLLVAALSFVGCLPAQRAVAALRDRLAALDAQLSAARDGLAATVGTIPRLLLVETEFAVHRLTAEREWVAALVADVESGALAWPTPQELAGVSTMP